MKSVKFFLLTSLRGIPSAHFEKYSVVAMMYEWPTEDFGVMGPTTSSPQASNGQDATVRWSGSGG